MCGPGLWSRATEGGDGGTGSFRAAKRIACAPGSGSIKGIKMIKHNNRSNIALVALSSMAFLATASAEPFLSSVEDAASYVGHTVSDTAKSVGRTASDVGDHITGDVDYAKARKELDATAATSLKQLFAASPGAKALFDQSYGYAVFDSHKSAFLLAVGTGAGVAVNKSSGKRTYMRMGSVGADLGAGLQFYRAVFLFETEQAFSSFVTSGWEASTAADAAFGKKAADAQLKFNGGMAHFELADSGAIVAATIAGTKYWVSDDLNGTGNSKG